tara:strand:+ start:4911 stop:6134 length:1224 start_codon:yes stop_codon:yes gene_type:complete
MNIYKVFTVNALFFLLLSCGSSLKSLETFVDSNIDVDSLVNNDYDLSLPKMENDSVGLYNSYNMNSSFLDSLYNELLDKKEVLLELKDKPYYNLLLAKSLTDTTYLTNMYVKTPTDGSPLSYEYDVKRNDLINYSIENIGSSRVDEVSILEGGSYRMVNQKLKKKQIEKGNIRIMDDNTFTLNIVNDGFLRNKGFLSSKLKIQLKKISPLNIIYEEVLDSVPTFSKSIEIVLDTIYKSNYNKELILNPILDITGKKKLVVPINVAQEDMNLVGWGYWVGLNKSNSLDWASNEDNDMINFARQELFNEDENLSLQRSDNDYIKLKINNLSLDTRTLNYSSNYAYYITDKIIEKPTKRAEIIIENLSKINTFKIQLGLVSVFFRERQVEMEKEKFEIKKIIKLTLQEDE